MLGSRFVPCGLFVFDFYVVLMHCGALENWLCIQESIAVTSKWKITDEDK